MGLKEERKGLSWLGGAGWGEHEVTGGQRVLTFSPLECRHIVGTLKRILVGISEGKF